MAALTITASQVLAPTDGTGDFFTGIAGVAITAGQSLYLDTTTNTYKLADSNSSQATARAAGIATHDAAAGQPIKGIGGRGGILTLGAGAAPVVGMLYCVGPAAGSIVPYSDLTTGDYVTPLGVGYTGNKILMYVFASNMVKP